MQIDEELRALIVQKREALGWSGAALAERAGTTQQTMQRIEAGAVKFSRAVPQILRALGIKPSLAARRNDAPIADTGLIGGGELVGDKDFPVYAAVQGGTGAMIVSTDPVQYVRRPDRLSGVPKGYGIMVVGESMVPAFWHGDIALVHPFLSVRSAADVVLYKGHEGEDREAIIKHLVRETSTAWHLRQWNPPEGDDAEFALSKEEWPTAHYVVGRYAGR